VSVRSGSTLGDFGGDYGILSLVDIRRVIDTAPAQEPPKGPKIREWGMPQGEFAPSAGVSGSISIRHRCGLWSPAVPAAPRGLESESSHSYEKPAGFVREGNVGGYGYGDV
jgi:hypothetical protein